MNLDIKDICEFKEFIDQLGFKLSYKSNNIHRNIDFYNKSNYTLAIMRPLEPLRVKWLVKKDGIIQVYSHSCVTGQYKVSDIRLLKRLFKQIIRDIRINAIV